VVVPHCGQNLHDLDWQSLHEPNLGNAVLFNIIGWGPNGSSPKHHCCLQQTHGLVPSLGCRTTVLPVPSSSASPCPPLRVLGNALFQVCTTVIVLISARLGNQSATPNGILGTKQQPREPPKRGETSKSMTGSGAKRLKAKLGPSEG
jgi:hypothetical protein